MMAETPSAIGAAVMQQLREKGVPPTPENYRNCYHLIAGLPQPEADGSDAAKAPSVEFCGELLHMLRQIVSEVSAKTEILAQDLGVKNTDLASNVSCLRSSRDRNEILRLLSAVVMQAGGIQHSVEASHKDLIETREALNSLQREMVETRQLLHEDPLTGALNRRGLDLTLSREIARAQRDGESLSLSMVDLDHFKKVNDTYGHEAGDQMLVHFAGLIKSVMRKTDALVRYGGEEFTLILPGTDARGAHFVLARLQQVMSKSPLDYEGKQINTTFSAGIAALQNEENGHMLIRRADEALYSAKSAGRNLIKIAA